MSILPCQKQFKNGWSLHAQERKACVKDDHKKLSHAWPFFGAIYHKWKESSITINDLLTGEYTYWYTAWPCGCAVACKSLEEIIGHTDRTILISDEFVSNFPKAKTCLLRNDMWPPNHACYPGRLRPYGLQLQLSFCFPDTRKSLFRYTWQWGFATEHLETTIIMLDQTLESSLTLKQLLQINHMTQSLLNLPLEINFLILEYIVSSLENPIVET